MRNKIFLIEFVSKRMLIFQFLKLISHILLLARTFLKGNNHSVGLNLFPYLLPNYFFDLDCFDSLIYLFD